MVNGSKCGRFILDEESLPNPPEVSTGKVPVKVWDGSIPDGSTNDEVEGGAVGDGGAVGSGIVGAVKPVPSSVELEPANRLPIKAHTLRMPATAAGRLGAPRASVWFVFAKL